MQEQLRSNTISKMVSKIESEFGDKNSLFYFETATEKSKKKRRISETPESQVMVNDIIVNYFEESSQENLVEGEQETDEGNELENGEESDEERNEENNEAYEAKDEEEHGEEHDDERNSEYGEVNGIENEEENGVEHGRGNDEKND